MNIVIFGAPGSGKGTQSKKIVEKYDLFHISTGDILRKEIAAGTELGLHAKDIIDHGHLISDDIMIEIIRHIIDANSSVKGFLFDGFPRTIVQAEALENMLAIHNRSILCTITLNVPQEELIRRILQRGLNSGRKDDSEIIIQQRLQHYKNKTAPVANFYKRQNKLHDIQGMNDVEIVFNHIVDIIESDLFQ